MSTTPLTPSQLSEDDTRELIAMFERARTPEQFRAAERVAKSRERSHRSATKANKRTRGFIGMVVAIPSQLRGQ